jgi:hypothetical protein
LGLKGEREWRVYYKSGQKPVDIPTSPQIKYKDQWQGLGDWLGTGVIANKNRAYRTFEEAREYVRSLGLKNWRGWSDYCKSRQKPVDIPCHPYKGYKSEWRGWGDWLGTGTIASYNKEFITFTEAREYVHTLGLKNLRGWHAYCKSGQKPDDIPTNPRTTYKDQWQGLGDWLGTGVIANKNREYRTFEEAREYVRSLGLKNCEEWRAHSKSEERPDDIPSTPREFYKFEWRGWGDWLGTVNRWNRTALLALLEDLRASIPHLSERELYMILQRQGALHGLYLAMRTRSPQILLRELKQNEQIVEAALAKVSDEAFEADDEETPYPPELPNDDTLLDTAPIAITDQTESALPLFPASISQAENNPPLPAIPVHYEAPAYVPASNETPLDFPVYTASSDVPSLPGISLPIMDFSAIEPMFTPNIPCPPLPIETPKEEVKAPIEPIHVEASHAMEVPVEPTITEESLHVVDTLQESLSGGLDEDLAETLVIERINDLWEVYMNDGSKAVNELLNAHGGHFFKQIKRRFNAERRAVNTLPIPDGWSFTNDKGKHCKPNLMQKRIAWMVRERHRVGNWSGVGAGKTLSAILASRVVGAEITLIVTNNATVQQWHDQILNAYPDSRVYTEIGESLTLSPDRHSFVVVNYEKFQLDSRERNATLLLDLHPDFIVFDEVQLVKQRYIDEGESNRREALRELVSKAAEYNPSLYVLGMSATPVINNLQEAKGLLEIIAGQSMSVGTMPTVNNALEMHKLFMQHGPRYRPRHTNEYEMPVRARVIKQVCNDLLDNLIDAQGSVLSTEQALLSAKLDLARPYFQKGTMIYTHYVDGIIEPTRQYLEDMGFTVGLYTGSDKSGYQLFCEGKVDILLGSSTVGIGLDGLQKVCSRIVMLSLPWTSAEYEQIIGRLHRQGQIDQVEVIVPQIFLDYKGDTWSWDEWRLALIECKRSLADCVLDGMVPDSVRMSQQELLKQGREALEKWAKRVEQDCAC